MNYMAEVAASKYMATGGRISQTRTPLLKRDKQRQEVEKAVSFENIGYARVKAERIQIAIFFIAGFSQRTSMPLPVTLVSGRLPENDREILLSGKATTEGGASYALGDTIFSPWAAVWKEIKTEPE